MQTSAFQSRKQLYLQLHFPFSIGMELRDTGVFGFLLPANQIIPTGEEVWAFHVSVARQVISEN